MGWLELMALMRRVLPLLTRVAPMLEGYIGARGAVQGDTEALNRLTADLKAQLAAATDNHADLKGLLDAQNHLLEAQNGRMQHLSDELQRLRAADAEKLARLEQNERQIAANTRLLRIASLLTVVLLLACTGLLIALLLRH